MLSFIYYRMSVFDSSSLKQGMKKYYYAQDAFIKAGIYCPGYKKKDRYFWLFPIVVPNKILFV
jgi:hypothetical protein